MFSSWFRGEASIPELTTVDECDSLLGNDLAIVFKHSPTCPVSLLAQREVLRFWKTRPEAPVYLVSVRRRRDLARHIAERTGIRHESPQVLVVRSGNVIGWASHDDITAELLRSLASA